MEIIKTGINGLILIQPKINLDERGHFFESYQKLKFQEIGINADFVQDNESKSQKGVLRGLHFQCYPFAQGKLVRVINGSVVDVAVDIRRSSPTYGKWFKVLLSEHNKTMMWIPVGFAHGFVTLEDNTIFQYKCTNYYNKISERSIIWNDPDLNIDWDFGKPIVSEKDMKGGMFKDLDIYF